MKIKYAAESVAELMAELLSLNKFKEVVHNSGVAAPGYKFCGCLKLLCFVP